MKRPKPIGFLVLDDKNRPMRFAQMAGFSLKGILLSCGRSGTLFSSYGRAYYAIDCTRVFRERRGIDIPTAGYRVLPVRPDP